MKKVISTIATVIVLVVITTGASVSAQAQDRCVSSAEFRKIKSGMSMTQVKNLTGTGGTIATQAGTGAYKIVIRNYKACTQFGAVSVGFMGGRVTSKSGVF